MVNGELVLHDLLFIEKRLERIEQNRKKNREDQSRKEEALLQRFKTHLENGSPLRVLEIDPEDRRIVSGYPLITLKEMIVALNVSDNDMSSNGGSGAYESQGIRTMRLPARLESEIASLESADEKEEFMRDAGIAEPAVDLLSRLCMDALGYISFFTVGSDEVRQWLIRRGALAPEAGGAIHSDIQRGFIRAEVIKYDDLIKLGTEDTVKKAGRLFIMGRDYAVEDDDIISFRFNV
jgi:ribosome-binding ATPase YchF (GTP1/OBG family)